MWLFIKRLVESVELVSPHDAPPPPRREEAAAVARQLDEGGNDGQTADAYAFVSESRVAENKQAEQSDGKQTPSADETGKKEKQDTRREKPSIRDQLKAAARSKPEQSTPAKSKKHEMGLE